MRIAKTRGQSTAEYAIVIALVVGALVVMQVYVKRGVQGRFKDTTDDYVQTLGNNADWNNLGSTCSSVTYAGSADYKQWEYDKLSGKRTRNIQQQDTTESRTAAGQVTRNITEQNTGASGDYQKYDYKMGN